MFEDGGGGQRRDANEGADHNKTEQQSQQNQKKETGKPSAGRNEIAKRSCRMIDEKQSRNVSWLKVDDDRLMDEREASERFFFFQKLRASEDSGL